MTQVRGIDFSKPLPVKEKTKYRVTIKERSKLDQETRCWMWTGTRRNRVGYGGMHMQGKRVLAHRVAYVVFNGEIPVNSVVRHTCDTSLCVNPKHLVLGTQADNVNDMLLRGRARWGIGGPDRKLSEPDLKSLRMLRELGYTMLRLSVMFNVSKSSIFNGLKYIESRKFKSQKKEK
jgi:HNH endonuclease